MTIDRRRFIGIAGIAGPAALVLLPSRAEGFRIVTGVGGTGSAVLLDTTHCAGCGRCQTACAKENRAPVPPEHLARAGSPLGEGWMAERPCGTCKGRRPGDQAPACVRACETGALAFGPRQEQIPIAVDRGSAGALVGPSLVAGLVALCRFRDRVRGGSGPGRGD
jgi:ferredoxin